MSNEQEPQDNQDAAEPNPVTIPSVDDASAASETSAQPGGEVAKADTESFQADAGEEKPKIQIGRKSGESPKQRVHKPVAEDLIVQEAEESAPPPPPNTGSIPTPTRRDPMTAELEQEIAAALGGQSLEELMAGDVRQDAVDTEELEVDSRRNATVVKVHGDNVFMTLGGPHEGVVSARQFKEPPNPGDSIEVVISGVSREDGLYELRVPGAAMDVSGWEDVEEGAVVDARVTGSNTGGLECMVNTVRGFIPASQIALYRVENFAEYVDKRLQCVVTEVNRERKNLVLSHRAVLERQREEERASQLATLQVGTMCEGVVRSIREFGAFVDLGGVDGLIHISQLSWDRVEHPSEVVKEGETVRVRIEKINPEDGKISLSLRSMDDHPWANIDQQFQVNEVVKGKVTRTANFGAFVKLAPGIEGLIHVSELAHHRVSRVDSVVSEGDEVEVKVLSINTDDQRIGLSLKATMAQPVKAGSKRTEEDELEEPRDMAVPEHDGPLKGGTNRPSGGEQFGLKW